MSHRGLRPFWFLKDNLPVGALTTKERRDAGILSRIGLSLPVALDDAALLTGIAATTAASCDWLMRAGGGGALPLRSCGASLESPPLIEGLRC